jgi:hypothetical protein
MKVTDFCSSNTYIFLPTKKNPKVALSVDSTTLVENAFKLYNPFSQKAKFLKKVSKFVFTNFNGLSKRIIGTKKEIKSPFVSYLEKKLGKSLVSSLYFATVNDKVVMQLQTSDAEIVGYLKYPLNTLGLQHLENEKKAIEVLSKKHVVHQYIIHDEFNGKPFLLLAALEGEIGLVERSHIDDLLLKFRREEACLLANHPRITDLKKMVATAGLLKYLPVIEKICQKSIFKYGLVYEHGDFTPWNIINVAGHYVPFDFEHFVEDGLEYFDLFKYYYQIGHLLERMGPKELIEFISEKINIKEFRQLLQLFLIKEIVRKKDEKESYDFEIKIIEELVK